jgi:hypothetical protein
MDGCLDASAALQIHYASDSLVDYEDSLHAEHETLPIRLELKDFTGGGTSWELTASHVDVTGPVSWSRASTGLCWHEFSQTSGEVAVTVIATDAGGSAPSKSKIIYVKIKPKGDKPDR